MHNLTITGARVHNLKNIDISIPKNKLIVATGISGSGKSSLVFDTIFEEGRRQYLRSLGMLSGVDDEQKFDTISGLAPTIAVRQSVVRQSNPRSTVGSRTRILNMLGLLYAGGSSRQGCNPAGASPAVSIAQVGHVAMPHPGMGNHPGDAWCKRPGRPARRYCGGCNLGA